ncbi:SRPBCC family protein [Mycobacterium sp. 852002-10029_SCH5224772]|uniref:SRPBCC family protein n=1 Tax=Mycobacterium sp. 852002-10029_SCH5224772 TaxID=1834083 RepID=UPI0007FFF379|nr:SRPBCC family protein [Mycobacterium sp. 852002-10029_SCH5224772]OBF10335.1 cyclase [Mycobacterium sp. 852002-10029_SCH5224772]
MTDIQRARTIAAAIDDVWNVLADFGSLSSWCGNVDHSCVLYSGPGGGPVGTARRVQVKRDALVERITEFDPGRTLAYDIDGLPRRLRRVTNRWTLTPAGGHTTRVSLTSTVEIGPGATRKLAERVLCRFLARQSDALLVGLANRLENGSV